MIVISLETSGSDSECQHVILAKRSLPQPCRERSYLPILMRGWYPWSVQTIIAALVFLFSPMTLCCHSHADGSVGCGPLGAQCDGWKLECPRGATQTDPDDDESWQCTGYPNS